MARRGSQARPDVASSSSVGSTSSAWIPETAPRDYLNRCRRKEAELVSALAAHGLTVPPEQVFTVSADPFGLVGDRTHVTKDMYRGHNRSWDAVLSVVEPLLAIDAATAERLHLHSVIDRG